MSDKKERGKEKQIKKYAFILTMILTGSMFFNIQTCSVEAKETKTVKKVNEIVQDISYVYKDKDGKMIYTTDVIVEEHEFAQNKDNSGGENSTGTPKTDKDGFMEAAEGEIPFD